MHNKLLLEICAFNVQACIIADRSGAGRIELCTDRKAGGTTPAYTTIKEAVGKTAIPIYPIIRPRGGDFFYNDEEYWMMIKSIEACKESGCAGIATGISLQNGEIDTERLKQLVALAYPMKVTCHRVFDRTPDPFKALEDIIACGCERILTSGQANHAIDATDTLTALVKAAGNRITIMPGAGVRASNIQQLITETGAIEYHSTACTDNTENINELELQDMLSILNKDRS